MSLSASNWTQGEPAIQGNNAAPITIVEQPLETLPIHQRHRHTDFRAESTRRGAASQPASRRNATDIENRKPECACTNCADCRKQHRLRQPTQTNPAFYATYARAARTSVTIVPSATLIADAPAVPATAGFQPPCQQCRPLSPHRHRRNRPTSPVPAAAQIPAEPVVIAATISPPPPAPATTATAPETPPAPISPQERAHSSSATNHSCRSAPQRQCQRQQLR